MDNRKNKSYLPSRKVIFLGSAVLAAFVVYGIVGNSEAIKNFVTRSTGDKTASKTGIKEQKRIDEDGDGLSNWQERLWGTNPNKSDTDGDGTPDGKEVEENRDPTIPGPDDSLKNDAEELDKATSSSNITTKIGSEVMPRALVIAAARENGENVSRNDLSRISDSIAEESKIGQIDLSDSSDINVSPDNKPSELKQYFEKLNDAVQKTKSKSTGHPIRIVARAQQNQNPESVNLSPHILRHSKAISEMKSMSVPARFQDFHLKSLQALERKLYSLRKMNKLADDPIGAVIGVKQYKKAKEADIEAAKMLNNSLKSYARRN